MSQDLNPERVMKCYKRYMDFVVDTPPTKKQYLRNMEEKMADPEFIGDIAQLIRKYREYALQAFLCVFANDIYMNPA